MDTLLAFVMGEKNRGKEMMVFDWDKAAKIIKEKKIKTAGAGLEGDWEYTGGLILKNGKPMKQEDTYTYLASTWAKPQLYIKKTISSEYIDCYKMQSKVPEWDSKTFWPESALKIINKK